MITPSQFPVVRLVDPVELTPDQVVGKYYCDARGNRGHVLYRFDQLTYYVVELHDDWTEQRLRGVNWLRTMRFFDTELELDCTADAFFRAARMGAGK